MPRESFQKSKNIRVRSGYDANNDEEICGKRYWLLRLRVGTGQARKWCRTQWARHEMQTGVRGEEMQNTLKKRGRKGMGRTSQVARREYNSN